MQHWAQIHIVLLANDQLTCVASVSGWGATNGILGLLLVRKMGRELKWETRHDFLVQSYFTGLHWGSSLWTSRKGKKLVPKLIFCSRQYSLRNRRCNQCNPPPPLSSLWKALQTHLLIYHPLHVKCLQYDNAIPNTRYERKVFQLRNRKQLSLKFTYGIQDRANLGDKKWET